MNASNELSEEAKVCYGFIKEMGQILGKKYKLSPSGIGAGCDEGIWLMSLDFQYYGNPLTEEEARRLIINCLNDFLDAANHNERLRPFLKNYPFEPKNVDLRIFSYTSDKKDIYYPFIRVISARRGKVAYFTKEESDPYHYKTEKYESYQEALDKLKEKSISNEGENQ